MVKITGPHKMDSFPPIKEKKQKQKKTEEIRENNLLDFILDFCFNANVSFNYFK